MFQTCVLTSCLHHTFYASLTDSESARQYARQLLKMELPLQFPSVFGLEADPEGEVLDTFLDKPAITNTEKKGMETYCKSLEGGLVQFMEKYKSQAGKKSSNIVSIRQQPL